MKKIVGTISMIIFTLLLTGCSNKVTVDDLKTNDWQMDREENKEDIKFKVSFTDHIMTWAPDMSAMKSEASNEWEKMGEDLGKQIVENIKYKVEYELNGKTIHLKEKDLDLDDDYTIEKDGKNIVLTPEDKDAQKLVLTPYSKKSSVKESSTTSSTSKKKESTDISKVVDQFKKDGLEVNNARKMTKDDYGMAPLKAKEGMIFGIQLGTDGEYQNARIFSFENIEDLNDTKKYYDELGKESSVTFSYTAADEDNLVLMQFNGDLPKDVVDKYVNVANLTLTPVSFETNTSSSQITEQESNPDSSSTVNAVQQQEQALHEQAAAEQAAAQQQAEQQAQQNSTQSQYGTVQPGETPEEIAARYGMSVDDFLDANGMDQNNYYFDPGQQVVVK